MNDTTKTHTEKTSTTETGTSRSGTAAGEPQKISELLAAAAAQAAPVVRAIEETQLRDPTPCAEYDVRALLNHLIQVVINFQALAARQEVDLGDEGDFLGGDWRTEFTQQTDRLVTAWAAPGADEGTAGSMGLPARTVAHMVLGDLTVHAWDLARATGQEYTPPPAVLDEVSPALGQMAPMARSAGVFGEPVTVADGATELEKLLAATGRDPHWTR
ncbi:TIGR03086 family metal-binding protein [Streptomyces sp. NBC_00344]|uniref:TIGR03086 family metal-binding protein n=1 Tax=Streptomyces sp. NBC_00344 TaxID=2975720 RepID=UPI002E2048BA